MIEEDRIIKASTGDLSAISQDQLNDLVKLVKELPDFGKQEKIAETPA